MTSTTLDVTRQLSQLRYQLHVLRVCVVGGAVVMLLLAIAVFFVDKR